MIRRKIVKRIVLLIGVTFVAIPVISYSLGIFPKESILLMPAGIGILVLGFSIPNY